MKLVSFTRSLVAAMVLSTAFVGVAQARDLFTAQLQAPAQESRVIARSTLWTCEGDVCRAMPRHGVSVSACRALVREIGPVTSYGAEDDQLSAAQIAECNASSSAARAAARAQQAQN
ncbi:MAG: hypothetical protein HXY28_01955 [Hydrogenophilaceae bacterium]|jgi:hypothetical protein|nr:hypothetical protein [Hydrogenophilaceae bacterium]